MKNLNPIYWQNKIRQLYGFKATKEWDLLVYLILKNCNDVRGYNFLNYLIKKNSSHVPTKFTTDFLFKKGVYKKKFIDWIKFSYIEISFNKPIYKLYNLNGMLVVTLLLLKEVVYSSESLLKNKRVNFIAKIVDTAGPSEYTVTPKAIEFTNKDKWLSDVTPYIDEFLSRYQDPSLWIGFTMQIFPLIDPNIQKVSKVKSFKNDLDISISHGIKRVFTMRTLQSKVHIPWKGIQPPKKSFDKLSSETTFNIGRKYSTKHEKNAFGWMSPLEPCTKKHVLGKLGRTVFGAGDIETVKYNDTHVPILIGYYYMRLNGKKECYKQFDLLDINLAKQSSYCSDTNLENENFAVQSSHLLERSNAMIIQYLKSLSETPIDIIYFHNLDFDGIFLLKTLSENDYDWLHYYSIDCRDQKLHHIKIVYKNGKEIELKCSFKLFPQSLENLAKSFCPDIGSKTKFDFEKLTAKNFHLSMNDLKKYHYNDLLITFNFIDRAFKMLLDHFQVDALKCTSASSIGYRVFRTKYFNDADIWYPNGNQQNFIRKAFYGGHVDVYKPYGKNIYAYDANSLYPFAMTKLLPTGKPIYVYGSKIPKEDLFGFFYCEVEAPKDLHCPVLPYRHPLLKKIIYPLGNWKAHYFSEEISYAQTLGYKINILKGYHYEPSERSFACKDFAESVYNLRAEAIRNKDTAKSLLFKLLLNGLYGRLGLNPTSIRTDILRYDFIEFDSVINMDNFASVKIANAKTKTFLVNRVETTQTELYNLRASISMAAAISAYGRLHMNPLLQKGNLYYTDTDSLHIDYKLDDELISSDKMGSFKFEAKIKEGIYLSAKSYSLLLEDGQVKSTMKGIQKSIVDHSSFKNTLTNNHQPKSFAVKRNFIINWNSLQVNSNVINTTNSLTLTNTREKIFNKKGIWVDTKPLIISEEKSN